MSKKMHEKKKRELNPKYKKEDCPHGNVDRRSSSVKTVMFYCKDCESFVASMPRERAEAVDKQLNQIRISSAEVQQHAANVLDNSTLTREQVNQVLALFCQSAIDYSNTSVEHLPSRVLSAFCLKYSRCSFRFL